MGPNAAIVIPGAREVRRNGTNLFRFRQSSDLLYLTGFDEPDALAVLLSGSDARPAGQFVMFLKQRDKFREQWTGRRLGTDEAPAALGCTTAYEVGELEARLGELIDGCHALYVVSGEDDAIDAMLLRVLRKLRTNERNGSRAPRQVCDLSAVLHEQRLIKDADARARMRRAAAITCEAHILAMRAARAGRSESDIRALIEFVFARGGGEPGYDTIVGCGNNATTLHYTACSATLEPGQLLLVDAGCEWGGYTADVTRTYPVAAPDGTLPTWTRAQRALYDVVLAAQQAGIAAARTDATIEDVHDACVRAATQGLVDLALLPQTSDIADLVARGEHRRYYIHRTSHFLGMDVHDVGAYFPMSAQRGTWAARPLQPGTVFTIEPGIYIRADAEPTKGAGAGAFAFDEFRGCGVRIEDDVLITDERDDGIGRDILTRDCPKDPAELLRLIGSGVTIQM